MQIVINCDAAFNKHHKVGGWAFWIEADYSLPLKASGEFKTAVDDNNAGELQCIANALKVAHGTYAWADADVILYTDSKLSIVSIKRGAHRLYNTQINYIVSLLKTCKSFKIKHVRAHTITVGMVIDDPHLLANDWCDKAARQHAYDAVARIKENAKSTSNRKRASQREAPPHQQRQKVAAGYMGRRRPTPYQRTKGNISGDDAS